MFAIYEFAHGESSELLTYNSPFVEAYNCPQMVIAVSELTSDSSKQYIKGIITSAAQRHGVNPDLMVKIAIAESGLNPNAKNKISTASGIFQFLTSTFTSQSKKYGIVGSKNDPYFQSELAALMISDGGLHHWSESEHNWK